MPDTWKMSRPPGPGHRAGSRPGAEPAPLEPDRCGTSNAGSSAGCRNSRALTRATHAGRPRLIGHSSCICRQWSMAAGTQAALGSCRDRPSHTTASDQCCLNDNWAIHTQIRWRRLHSQIERASCGRGGPYVGMSAGLREVFKGVQLLVEASLEMTVRPVDGQIGRLRGYPSNVRVIRGESKRNGERPSEIRECGCAG